MKRDGECSSFSKKKNFYQFLANTEKHDFIMTALMLRIRHWMRSGRVSEADVRAGALSKKIW